MTVAVPSAPPNPAERLAGIIDGLCKAVAAHGIRGVLTAPLILLLWSRLSRMAGRARRLGSKMAAGAPLSIPRPAASRRTQSRPYVRLPYGVTWLVRAVPGTAAGASQLRFLLTDPQMAELANTKPMRRLLRPLCRLLGVDMPSAPKQAEAAPPPPDAAGPACPKPEPPAPAAAPPPPDPPCLAVPSRAA